MILPFIATLVCNNQFNRIIVLSLYTTTNIGGFWK